MKVSEAMTRDVRVVAPDQPIADVARMLAELDAGVMPVGQGDQLVGMITDRDIAIRAVGERKGPDTPVREIMTPDIKFCFEDEDVVDAARTMSANQIRRLPVLNRDKRLVGIISLGDVSVMESSEAAAAAIGGISQPGGEHSQTGGPRT